MQIYLLTMLLAVCICLRMQTIRNNNRSLMRNTNRAQVFYCMLLVAVLGVVVGWRKYVGTDYGNYIDVYNLTKGKTYAQVMKENEPFYGVINLFFAKQFNDYVPLFVSVGVVSVALIVYGIYNNSLNYPVSVFLFIAGMYFFDFFNGMRQMIATAIMFAAYPIVKKRKWIWLGFLTVIAAQFHASAYIILIVFVYSYYVRPRSWLNLILIGTFLVVYLQFSGFSDKLVDLLISTESSYSNYETMLLQDDMGANILRFGLTAVPPILSMVFWNQLSQAGKDAEILTNISLINACFMFIATQNWVFARVCMFFGIYNILLWPLVLDCFDPKSKRLMIVGVTVVYFSYFWLIVHTDSNLLPYESWLFGGIYA